MRYVTSDFSMTLSAIIHLAELPRDNAGFGGGVEFTGCRLESLHLVNGELHAIYGDGGAVIDSWDFLADLTRGATDWKEHRS
jgi:hypothetical protein